ncbi:hypothetical protein BOO86_19855 [Mycobacterium sp. CBMA 234]|nr:hypothetical protein [Mycolicibacterium sp. CBMA 234]
MTEPEESAELTESSDIEATSEDEAPSEVESPEAEGAESEVAAPEPVASNDAVPHVNRRASRGIEWMRMVAYRIVPALAVVLVAAAAGLWYLTTTHASAADRDKVVKVARDGTVAILSYQPETVRQQLTDARKLLTTPFLNDYTTLTKQVIPGAEERHMASVTTVPAAAAVSVDGNHAVVLLFVNQKVIVGGQPPTETPTTARVTLERLGGQWLIAKFEPV